MRCRGCGRDLALLPHTDVCPRGLRPAPRHIAKRARGPVVPERLYFTVDARPLNATAYSLLAELHESYGDAP